MRGWEHVKPDTLDKPFSPSSVKTFMRCPKQYEYAYVKGMRKPPNFKMVFGSAIHKGIETNYAHKYQHGKDLNVSDVHDAFRDDMTHRIKDESLKVNLSDKKRAIDEGIVILASYQNYVAPFVQPVFPPELELVAPVPGLRRKLRGFIDLVANVKGRLVPSIKNALRDTKTTSRMYSQEQTDVDPQLTIYAYLLKKVKDVLPTKVQFDVIVRKNAGSPECRTVSSTRTEKDFKRMEEQLKCVESAIKAGSFFPTDNHQTCSWCGYRELCHKGRKWARAD